MAGDDVPRVVGEQVEGDEGQEESERSEEQQLGLEASLTPSPKDEDHRPEPQELQPVEDEGQVAREGRVARAVAGGAG